MHALIIAATVNRLRITAALLQVDGIQVERVQQCLVLLFAQFLRLLYAALDSLHLDSSAVFEAHLLQGSWQELFQEICLVDIKQCDIGAAPYLSLPPR